MKGGVVDAVKRIVVSVRGDRDFPLTEVKLPEVLVSDLPKLLDAALRLNPALTPEHIIRGVWRHGMKEMKRVVSHPMHAQAFLKDVLPPSVGDVVPADLSKVPPRGTPVPTPAGTTSRAGDPAPAHPDGNGSGGEDRQTGAE